MVTKAIPPAPKLPAAAPTASPAAVKKTVRRKTPQAASAQPALPVKPTATVQPAAPAQPVVVAPKPKPKATPVAKPQSSAGKAGKKPVKPRPVLVRDSFTMPEADFALIATLKSTALGARRAAKKSELLRAGLHILAGLDAESLVVVLDRLETVKTGRPKKGH
jgi:hypothetical protein